MSTIRLENVGKFYEQGEVTIRAVDGVDLTVEKGEFSALAGPSGSGKSTLLNLIGGLDKPDQGQIYIDGESTHDKSDVALSDLRLHKVGFVFQAYNLIPVLTALENAEFVLLMQDVPPAERQQRVRAVFKELGIDGLEDRFPAQLSGGQQQRVAVARAVASGPAIVLADEPTANLDSETAKSLMKLMRQLNEQDGVTFIFSSHDPLVLSEARRVIRMRDGKVVADELKQSMAG